METKTSDSYQRDVLAKYKNEKGGEMSFYLAQPTPSQIREACLVLLEKRKSKNDQKILSRFFQFDNEENRIREIQNFDGDKFKPIINFLKGGVKKTHVKNIELISWLIDFKPRPYQEYIKPEASILVERQKEPNFFIEQDDEDIKTIVDLDRTKNRERDKQEKEKRRLAEFKRKEEEKKKRLEEERRRRRRIITISISVTFGMTLMILGIQKWPSYFPKNNPKDIGCMTWADSLYVSAPCDKGPFSQYGTKVEPLIETKLKNLRKVKVDAAYEFFSKEGMPLIWYYKKNNNEIEYFTAPGLHPTNGETLRKITPYIIQTYVPFHANKRSSFIQ